MANSTLEISDSDFSFRSQLIYSSLTLFLLTSSSALNCGIIWYENNIPNVRRTLINQMISLTALYDLFHTAVGSILIAIRYNVGPMGTVYCELTAIANIVTKFLAITGLNETMVLRYLFTCRFRTAGALNDDFFRHFFIVVNNFLTCYIFGILYFTGAMQDTEVYNFCIKSERPKREVNRMTRAFRLIFVVMVLFQLALYAKMRLHRSKQVARLQPVNTINGNAYSIVNTKTSILAFLTFLALSALLRVVVKPILKMIDFEEMELRKNIVPAYLLAFKYLTGFFIPLLYYCSCGELRRKIWSSLRQELTYTVNE